MMRETYLKRYDEINDAPAPACDVRKQINRRRKHNPQDAQEVGYRNIGESERESKDAADERSVVETGAEAIEDGREIHFLKGWWCLLRCIWKGGVD